MKLAIDTNTDSAEDIHQAIMFLQNILQKRGLKIEQFNIQNNNTSSNNQNNNQCTQTSITPKDRLAKKIERAKAFEEKTNNQNVQNEEDKSNENFAPIAFNMFGSEPTTQGSSNNQNTSIKEENSEQLKESSEEEKMDFQFMTY